MNNSTRCIDSDGCLFLSANESQRSYLQKLHSETFGKFLATAVDQLIVNFFVYVGFWVKAWGRRTSGHDILNTFAPLISKKCS